MQRRSLHRLWMTRRTGACSSGAITACSLLLRCLCLAVVLLMLGCQRPNLAVPAINDTASVCGFWIDDNQFHVTTTINHWIWRDQRWHRQPASGGHCLPPTRFLRMPDNTVIELSEGKLTLAPAKGDALTTRGDLPWMVDLIFRSQPPYFTAQRDYRLSPIHIYALDMNGSVWRGSVSRSGERLLVEQVDRLSADAQPLRVALDDEQLFVLYRIAGELHVERVNTAFQSIDRLNAL